MTLVKPNTSKTFPFYLLAEIAEMFFHTFISFFVYIVIDMLFTYCCNLKSNAINGGIGTPQNKYIFKGNSERFLTSNYLLAFYLLYSSGIEPTFSSAIYIYFLLSQLNAAFLAVFFTLCSM